MCVCVCVSYAHLGQGSGVRPRPNRRAGGLHVQEVVVDERPRPLHSAAVEVVAEGSDVRVTEHAAVQVLQRAASVGGSGEEPLLERAAVLRGQGAGLAGGPGLGAAVLEQQVLNALHGRVVGQVASARPPHPPGAQGVGAQGAAVARSPAPSSPTPFSPTHSSGAAQVQRRRHKF